jgi:hypothetical protein
MSTEELEAMRRPAAVAAAGAILWTIGIMPVPMVYMESDPGRRLELLKAGRTQWVVGETLAAAGTAAVPVAFVRVVRALPPGRARQYAALAAAALVAGAPLFIHDLAIRASDIERFAEGRLPQWTFQSFAWLHVAAVAALAATLANLPGRTGAASVVGLTAAAGGAFLASTRDLAPIVPYTAELVAAVSLARRR